MLHPGWSVCCLEMGTLLRCVGFILNMKCDPTSTTESHTYCPCRSGPQLMDFKCQFHLKGPLCNKKGEQALVA